MSEHDNHETHDKQDAFMLIDPPYDAQGEIETLQVRVNSLFSKLEQKQWAIDGLTKRIAELERITLQHDEALDELEGADKNPTPDNAHPADRIDAHHLEAVLCDTNLGQDVPASKLRERSNQWRRMIKLLRNHLTKDKALKTLAGVNIKVTQRGKYLYFTWFKGKANA